MSAPNADSAAGPDRHLLYGMLALQMNFITRATLATALKAWVQDKNRSLQAILVEQGALKADVAALIEPIVQKQLEMYGNDVQKTLAALQVDTTVLAELQQIADGDTQASLSAAAGDTSADAPTVATEAAPTPGRRYVWLRYLAKGGIGTLSVARDVELDREVALKEIQDDKKTNLRLRDRFEVEARITGVLEHPGVVPVYGLGKDPDGCPYYAMRLIRGKTMRQAIRAIHTLADAMRDQARREADLRNLLRRFHDVCNTIDYAHNHKKRVLHRDLKPDNVMLGDYGETLVIDWGLTKVLNPGSAQPAETGSDDGHPAAPMPATVAGTLQGSILGTPGYMSPEQASGQTDLGPATDVYGLGAVLYCILTNRAPIEGTDWATATVSGNFPRPRAVNRHVPLPLEAVCLKAMALEPDRRYATVKELGREIERWLNDEPVNAWPEPWWIRFQRYRKAHRAQVIALLLVAIGVLSILPIYPAGLLACAVCAAVALAQRLLPERLARPAGASRGVAVGLVAGVVAWALPQWIPAHAENGIQDTFTWLRGRRPTSARVVVVDFDDPSLRQLGKPLMFASPEIAEIVAYLNDRKARAIGLNLILPANYGGLKELEVGQVGDATRLGAAIQASKVVVLAESFEYDLWTRPLPQWQLQHFTEPRPDDFGFLNLTEDEDYINRRQQLMARGGDEEHRQFGLALAAVAGNWEVAFSDEDGLQVDKKPVPLDSSQFMRINFVGPPGTTPVFSFADVLAAARNKDAAARPPVDASGAIPLDVTGAIVIVGTREHRHMTPYSTRRWSDLFGGSVALMSDSEIQANVIATLVDRAFLVPVSSWVTGLPLLLVCGVLLGLALEYANPGPGFGLALLHLLIWAALALACFYAGLLLPLTPLLLVSVTAYTTSMAVRLGEL